MALETTPPGSSPSPPLEAVSTLLTHLLKFLSTNLALYRMVAVLVVCHWDDCPHHTLHMPLLTALTDTSSLEDIIPYIHNMQKDCQVSSTQTGGQQSPASCVPIAEDY